jgi:hypothetical protein
MDSGNGNHTKRGDALYLATSDLITYVGAKEWHFAEAQFRFLLDVLKLHGNLGKQIRYVQRELGQLGRDARHVGAEDVAARVSLYSERLPKAADETHISAKELKILEGLEAAIVQSALEAARYDTRAAQILELRYSQQ